MEPIYHADVCNNISVHLASYAPAELSESHFVVKRAEISPGNLQEGETLVQNLFISLDPYLRNFMKPGSPISVGQVLRGYGVCRVVACKSAHFQVGQLLMGIVGWERFSVLEANICPSSDLPPVPEYVVARGQNIPNTMFVIPDEEASKLPLSYNVGPLGMPGFTAYAAVEESPHPPPASASVFVSAATGAVGQLVGQLCKQLGCRHVVGSAGSDEKVQLLCNEFGYSGAFNYKTAGDDLVGALRKFFPDGIDFFVDGVGGKMLDAVFHVANLNARIVAVGGISGYDKGWEPLYNYMNIVGKELMIKGLFVVDHKSTFTKFRDSMINAIKKGDVKCREDVVEGVENIPAAYVGLMHGKNIGKLVVKVE